MLSQENPGVLGYVIIALGVVSVVLIIAGAATEHWIKVPGHDSVLKTKAKFLAATNTTIDIMKQQWPAMQAQYDAAAAQIPVITAQIATIQASIAAAPGSSGQSAALVAAIGQAQAGLVQVYTALAQLEALNASLNVIEPMEKLDTYGGFVSMCSFTTSANAFVCGSPSEFRDEALDITCEPDYVAENQTVPTVESILEETRTCNANGLAKALLGGKTMFFVLPIIIAVLMFIPIAVIGVMSFMPAKRGMPFQGTIVGGLFVAFGVISLILAVLFSVLIVGAYGKKDMKGTGTGLSWILVLLGAIVGILAGGASFLVRPAVDVQPE